MFSISAMTIDPGSVPKAAIPTLDDDYENDTEAVDRLVGMESIFVIDILNEIYRFHDSCRVNKYRRFCKRCKAFKPIRAHHCSICRRCIVKVIYIYL